jgi:hypothetical protein
VSAVASQGTFKGERWLDFVELIKDGPADR